MYEWLLEQTTDVRFILLVIFAFFLLCIAVGVVWGMIAGPEIPDGKGKRRATADTPDPERTEDGKRPRVRFVDEETMIDEKTGEVLN